MEQENRKKLSNHTSVHDWSENWPIKTAKRVCDIKVIQISTILVYNKNMSDVSRRNFAISKEINFAKLPKKFNTIIKTLNATKIYRW